MRALIQRVSSASVNVEGKVVGSMGTGLLVFLGVGVGDTREHAEALWDKVLHLRILDDGAGKANLSLADTQGDCMVISQFTLLADCRKGRRPSFSSAMGANGAEQLYEYFAQLARQSLPHVALGEFGAMMEVSLVNDGPFTIWLDTDELCTPMR